MENGNYWNYSGVVPIVGAGDWGAAGATGGGGAVG